PMGIPPATSLTQSAIQSFLDSRRVDRGAADLTIDAYGRDLAQWAEWTGPRALAEVEAEDLEAFVQSLAEASASTLARKISTLRQFFKFCCLELGLERNPAEQLRSPALPKRLPKALSLEDMKRLLQEAEAGFPFEESLRPALQARDR